MIAIDSDINRWSLREAQPDDAIVASWDPNEGDPEPGSLRLELTGDFGFYESECVNVSLDDFETLTFQGRALPHAAVCGQGVLVYSEHDCQGTQSIVAFATGIRDTDDPTTAWYDEFLPLWDGSGPRFASLRAMVGIEVVPECHHDTLIISSVLVEPEPVPALGAWSLIWLFLAMGVLGAWSARRLHDLRCV